MEKTTVKYQYVDKNGTLSYETTNKNIVYKKLLTYMRSKYIFHAPWIKKLVYTPLHNGYQKIVIYEDNKAKDIFIIEDSINEFEGE